MNHAEATQPSSCDAGVPRKLPILRGLCSFILVAALLVLGVTTASAQTINATVTADNAYRLAYGTPSGITNFFANVENNLAANIFSCGPGPEIYPNIPYVPKGYLYLVAYSDNAVSQGVLAQFVSGSKTTYTGSTAWQVYATGIDFNPGSGGPSVPAINSQIAIANAGTGGPGSSHGWVGPNGGPTTAGYVGTLAIGEDNSSASGDFPQVCTSAIGTPAKWMWYNPSALADPFTGNVPGEYLIFRLPFSELTNPRRVIVNKDITNPTNQTATGVDILIAGHHSQINDIFHGTTPNFTVTQLGPDDLLSWSGGNIAPGATVHVGFNMPEASVDILGIFMTNNGVNIGCAHQCNSNLHLYGFGGNITYTNSVSACESRTLYVGNITLMYFENELDLALMNPHSTLSPIHTDRVNGPPVRIDPGQSATVPVPPAPKNGNWVLARYTVSTSPTLAGPGNTEDFVQVPVPPVTAAAGACSPAPPLCASTTAGSGSRSRGRTSPATPVPARPCR